MSDASDAVDDRQLRAARAVLNFSLVKASQALGVSISVLVRAERSDTALDQALGDQLKRGYEQHGITFTRAPTSVGLHLSTP